MEHVVTPQKSRPRRLSDQTSATCLWLLAIIVLRHPLRAVAADEAGVMAELAKLRAIQPTDDMQELDRLNKSIGVAFKFLYENRPDSLPVVIRELRTELTKQTPDQYFILNTAFYLVSKDPPEEDAKVKRDLALDAIKHIDPKARVVEYNFLLLVRFAHTLAKLGDPQLLPQIDRIFLESDREVAFFDNPRFVNLPAQSVRVMLYGATGPSSEDHLAKRLNEKGYEAHQRIILALLVELGSERSVDAVKQVLNTRGDLEHFAMAATMLMKVGGPKGRDALLMPKTDHLDAKSKGYLEEIRDSAKATSFETLEKVIKTYDVSGRVFDDAELAVRLKKYAASGVDREIDASNVLSSKIPKAELLSHLKQIRSRTLWRFHQDALFDVNLTNQIMNAVQYKSE